MVKIEVVEPDSYADELGLSAGDRLLTINGHEINDLIDYHLRMDADRLNLEILRCDDEVWEFDLEVEPNHDLGLVVTHPQPQQCGNQCLFCFVHQLPKGMRRSLYIKDEDYRFSYLYGSYMTLTNLDEAAFQRIIRDHLSPLYISVHATNHELRKSLLGAEIPEIMPLLKRLTAAGIELHCQVVLCPDMNDGTALEQTISDLASFYPQVQSLAVVPVGLTKYRTNLPRLKKVTAHDAILILQLIEHYQQKFLLQHGRRFVYPADEFYLLASSPLPPYIDYEDFSQIENGVGMIAQFRQQISEVLLETEPLKLNKVILITGVLFEAELRKFADRIGEVTGVKLEVIAIKNEFFGSEITVTGLITATDLIQQLCDRSLGDGIIVPDVMLKDGQHQFLDDMTIEDVSHSLQVPAIVVENSPWGVLEGMENLAEGEIEVIQL